jgi:hypothetical protein
MDSVVWNTLLTVFLALLGWVLKEKAVEINRLGILLNKTREEVAKEYVTKVEVHADINRVLDRLERLDTKLDRLVEVHKERPVMPYASDKQKRLMQAVAHNPAFAKKAGIPQSVGQKFEAHKAEGGEIMAGKKLFGGKESYAEELKEAKAIKSGRISPQQYARGEQKEEAGMKKMAKGGGVAPSKMGAVKTAAPSRDGIASKGKTKGKQIVQMKRGGKC